MELNFLFPNRFKRIGWILLIPSAIFGFYVVLTDYEPHFFDWTVPSLFMDNFMGEGGFFRLSDTNILNEILGILVILSSLFVAFSKEKIEDEYIAYIRMKSLIWAVYVNYGVLILSFLLIYGSPFLWVMIFNMFTILWVFIIKFKWGLRQLKKSDSHEK